MWRKPGRDKFPRVGGTFAPSLLRAATATSKSLSQPLKPRVQILSWLSQAEGIPPEAKQTYLKVFWNRDEAPAKIQEEFSKLYTRWYGRRRYWAPMAFVFMIAAIENFYLAGEFIRLVVENAKLTTSAAAIAGAYTFVAWDFFGRVQRRSLSTTDILRGLN